MLKHAIVASRLRAIQCRIRPREDRLWRVTVGYGRQPKADRDRQTLIHFFPQSLAKNAGSLQAGFGEHDDKLFRVKSSRRIGVTHRPLDHIGQLAENTVAFVPALVAVEIVKMIDVHENQRKQVVVPRLERQQKHNRRARRPKT